MAANHLRVVIPEPGPPHVLQVVEERIPQPGPGQVRVKVLAAGVARADILMRRGEYPGPAPHFPYTPGYDVAGVVDSLGEGSSEFRPGDHVAGCIHSGGYAQYACVAEGDLARYASELDPAQVVSLALNGLTAYQSMFRLARVQSGEKALFHAAASGVGNLQLQLGRRVGLEMFATASAAKQDVLRDFGAQPIDYQNEDFARRIRELSGDGVDAAFDPVGGSHFWGSFRALKPGGRLIAYGEMRVAGVDHPSRKEVYLHHHLPGWLNWLPGGRSVSWYEMMDEKAAHPDWYQADLAQLFQLLQEREMSPLIAARIGLGQAPEAHALIERAAVSGKMVLLPHGGAVSYAEGSTDGDRR
jgi:NADPH:quinone reductase-like Zn-dependent oxidoreductase